ncbi:hypothetical protein COO91_00177 [Nostoc flagelliforme CCNUN1]|uniref:Uncharacterized protein n=1 Tax=Nostoc flagelliforme CCNUN1 TaxID=2038116 RepID=A0A2K8SFZ9_9NOSO|nr:hypothetical protein COO91_00177 [Nostoc flagelliforme CCNUN1]
MNFLKALINGGVILFSPESFIKRHFASNATFKDFARCYNYF